MMQALLEIAEKHLSILFYKGKVPFITKYTKVLYQSYETFSLVIEHWGGLYGAYLNTTLLTGMNLAGHCKILHTLF